jgi:hypothetical protein
LNHTYVVVDDLGEGSQTVGGTRGVGDDLVLGLVGLEVNTTDEPVYQLCARVEVGVPYMGASAEGAEMMTFLAPPFKWAPALSMVVKTPVASMTYSAPAEDHLISAGSRSLKTVTGLSLM